MTAFADDQEVWRVWGFLRVKEPGQWLPLSRKLTRQTAALVADGLACETFVRPDDGHSVVDTTAVERMART